jgi:hypothetical protein
MTAGTLFHRYEPERSVIMEVRAFEIVASEAFKPAGMCLRFPRCGRLEIAACIVSRRGVLMTAGTFPNRCEAFRPPSGENGKAWDQGETYDDVKQLFTSGKAKLAASKRTAEEVARVQAAGLEDGGGKRRKRQGGGAGATRTVGVLSHLRLADLSQVAQESKILEGVRAWVVAKDEGRKREVDTLVHRLGGSPRANHIVSGAERTTLIVDGDPAPGNYRTNEFVKEFGAQDAKGEDDPKADTCIDIVSAEWLEACDAAQRLLPLEPRYVRYATRKTRDQMEASMDQWGCRCAAALTRLEIVVLPSSSRPRLTEDGGHFSRSYAESDTPGSLAAAQGLVRASIRGVVRRGDKWSWLSSRVQQEAGGGHST